MACIKLSVLLTHQLADVYLPGGPYLGLNKSGKEKKYNAPHMVGIKPTTSQVLTG